MKKSHPHELCTHVFLNIQTIEVYIPTISICFFKYLIEEILSFQFDTELKNELFNFHRFLTGVGHDLLRRSSSSSSSSSNDSGFLSSDLNCGNVADDCNAIDDANVVDDENCIDDGNGIDEGNFDKRLKRREQVRLDLYFYL